MRRGSAQQASVTFTPPPPGARRGSTGSTSNSSLNGRVHNLTLNTISEPMEESLWLVVLVELDGSLGRIMWMFIRVLNGVQHDVDVLIFLFPLLSSYLPLCAFFSSFRV